MLASWSSVWACCKPVRGSAARALLTYCCSHLLCPSSSHPFCVPSLRLPVRQPLRQLSSQFWCVGVAPCLSVAFVLSSILSHVDGHGPVRAVGHAYAPQDLLKAATWYLFNFINDLIQRKGKMMTGKLAWLVFLLLIKLLQFNCEFYPRTALLSLLGIWMMTFSKVSRF